jgi:DNA mismatch repair protein MutS
MNTKVIRGVEVTEQATPLIRQWAGLVELVRDNAIALFRLGDFYESFGDDAVALATAAQVALTKRNGIPMAGIPFHARTQYIKRVYAAGRSVVLFEKGEDGGWVALDLLEPEDQ